jgi:hypothetical protein
MRRLRVFRTRRWPAVDLACVVVEWPGKDDGPESVPATYFAPSPAQEFTYGQRGERGVEHVLWSGDASSKRKGDRCGRIARELSIRRARKDFVDIWLRVQRLKQRESEAHPFRRRLPKWGPLRVGEPTRRYHDFAVSPRSLQQRLFVPSRLDPPRPAAGAHERSPRSVDTDRYLLVPLFEISNQRSKRFRRAERG